MKRFIVFMVTASTTLSCLAAGYGELDVPGWFKFLMLLMIAWGILEIILFFKIWGMTNDVRKLTNQFCKQPPKTDSEPAVKPVYNSTSPNDYKMGDYDSRLDKVKVGDKVTWKQTMKEYIVEDIKSDKVFINRGFAGSKWISKSELITPQDK